jgi:thiol:disulfide interchange protein DsbD
VTFLGGRARLAACAIVSIAAISACKEAPARTDFEETLIDARAAGRPVMLIFGADWCAACRLLDRETLDDPRVVREASRFQTIRIDLGRSDDAAAALGRRFDADRLPTVAFISSSGAPVESARVTGFVDAGALLRALEAVR